MPSRGVQSKEFSFPKVKKFTHLAGIQPLLCAIQLEIDPINAMVNI